MLLNKKEKDDQFKMEPRSPTDFEDGSDQGSVSSLETSSSSGSALELPSEWEVAIADDRGRLYYLDNEKKSTHWCPPTRSWKCCFGLPAGWEVAVDIKNYLYYINHSSKLTSYKHPNYDNRQFEVLQQAFQARRRKVSIKRNLRDGFGFVAGSEKPVIIRSVVADSPADGQLSANDQIFSINGQVAYNLPQPQVISMIRSCTDVLEMEVVATEDIQDVRNQGTLKSALMSRATRERRKSCPVTVRFEEKPKVLSLSTQSILSVNIIKQMIPNVLKIFLENGQTKSFQYNTETTVKEIFDSLIERLQIKAPEYFSLVLIGGYRNQSIFLQPEDRVTQIVNKKVFSRWECRLELSFAPEDAYELLRKDPVAFDYWYQQTYNSVVKGHFGADLKFEVIMRLSALQIHAAMTSKNDAAKFSLKDVSKEYGGLDDFLPSVIITGFKKKEIKKALNSHLKSIDRIALPGQKLTSLQAKLHYLKIASENPAFGGKTFSATVVSNQHLGSDSSVDSLLDTSDVLVSPSQGICMLFSETGNVLQHLVEFSQVCGIVITSHMLNKHHLKIFVKDRKAVSLILSPQEADDMAFLINGYYKIEMKDSEDLPIFNLSKSIPRFKAPQESKAPGYQSEHSVVPSTWSYIDDVVPTLWLGNNTGVDYDDPRSITMKVDFASGPPSYNAHKGYERASFLPLHQGPAVDSFIRELSIRDKKKRSPKVLNKHRDERMAQKKITNAGQFDTIKFGVDDNLDEDQIDGSDGSDDSPSNSRMKQHIITCSMSSDDETSDEEMTDLARKINRSATVGRLQRNKEKRAAKTSDSGTEVEMVKGKLVNLGYQTNPERFPEDEEDSGWRTDTSSNTGSLGRTWSNPWGTFSEEDSSSDRDTRKQLADADSLLSSREQTPVHETVPGGPFQTDDQVSNSAYMALHEVTEDATSTEFSPKHGISRANNRDSFNKYLVQKVPNDASELTKHNPLDFLSSDAEERPGSLLRPFSNTSDDVFAETNEASAAQSNGKPTYQQLVAKSVQSPSGSPKRAMSPRPDSVSSVSSSPLPRPSSSTSSEVSLPMSPASPQPWSDEGDIDRPQSVNLADLNIYIPSPPKKSTRALSPSELRIPSPPCEFADHHSDVDTSKVKEINQSPDSSTLSSRSSSPEDVVEFMVEQSLNESNKTNEESVSSPGSSPEEVVEFMKPEELTNIRLYEAERAAMKNDSIDIAAKKINNSSTCVEGTYSTNIGIANQASASKERPADVSIERESQPTVLPLKLPKSPSLDLKNERVTSPLFFSVDNISPASSPTYNHFRSNSDLDVRFDHSDPFQQLVVNQSPTHGQHLILPNTPTSLRRNMYKSFGSADNVTKSTSLPNGFTFDDFNEFLDLCKTAISKTVKFEDQLVSLIEENRRANRLSFEGDDPERQSYLDVMRTCSKSLSNRMKEVVTLATNANVKCLHKLVRSSQNEVENLVVAMTTVKNSTTLANLIKDVVLDYRDVMKYLKRSTGKSFTDPDAVKLIEKTNEMNFALTILIRGLRSY